MSPETRTKVDAMPFQATLVYRAQKPRGESDKWRCVLDGFEVDYSKGVGLREGFKMPYRGLTLHDMEQFKNPKVSRTVDPTKEEVLEALACDARCYLDAKDIDDFASEFGYQDSVSKAFEAWNACAKAAKFFQVRGLDPEDFQEE